MKQTLKKLSKRPKSAPKMGRPKKKTENLLASRIEIRVTARELATIKDAAKKRGVTLANHVRDCLGVDPSRYGS
jgi:predicted DNA binding CopG/RHH family protein